MVTNWNVELRSRKEVIEVKKILQRIEEGPADFPEMTIIDQKGRKHTLAYIDFSSARDEWEQIQEGSKIELTLKESVVDTEVLSRSSLKL